MKTFEKTIVPKDLISIDPEAVEEGVNLFRIFMPFRCDQVIRVILKKRQEGLGWRYSEREENSLLTIMVPKSLINATPSKLNEKFLKTEITIRYKDLTKERNEKIIEIIK